eukprot:Seg1838.4 transcript_id=Seg1838.4/GoldUCD/mRNA.D3Y31 product="YTH domain-containing family protein 2" protein_id=Seg1838.4/GoldUCD/D3Y31
MVGMSTTFDQRVKENGPNNPGSTRKGETKGFNYNSNNLPNQNQLPQQPDVRPANMPETFVSGYYPNTNNAYQIPFQSFGQQPAWSTGTNSQPQGFDHNVTNYGFGGLAPGGATENQFMAPDHLFNPSNSGFANTFTAPYVSGTGWSYFNNPNSFFFPTGNADLNLTWGTPENPNAQVHQDLYKPPPPPEHEKAKIEELSTFENGEIQDTESVEKALSQLTVTSTSQGDVKDANDPTVSSSVPAANKGAKNSASSAPTGTSNAPAKPASWAAVASQPAKPKPPPTKTQKAPVQLPSSSKPNYSNQNGSSGKNGGGKQQQGNGNAGRWNRQNNSGNGQSDGGSVSNSGEMPKDSSPLLRELWAKNNFNPKELNLDFKNARFFIIKSYSEDDIFRSIKYSIWTSTEHGNRRLNEAFKEQQKAGNSPIYMLFSVNGSGHFCGVATMMSSVDIHIETGVWVQDKWKGRFDVKWIYVKDVPNSTLRHIRLENNENKPITNSRDTQEVPAEKGKNVIKILHSYKAQTSIFDDFSHYEQRQEEDARIRGKKIP